MTPPAPRPKTQLSKILTGKEASSTQCSLAAEQKMDQDLRDYMKNFCKKWLKEQWPEPGMPEMNWMHWWSMATTHEVGIGSLSNEC